ncbi:MAG TPA: carboxypeptidase-like regulatory domain-containing protein [Ferruginibacter sp.]|jgi:hypothetical protein|nr:carboxypeptidase-like regulatory domain-containing protein [Ferruginibacter sp.]
MLFKTAEFFCILFFPAVCFSQFIISGEVVDSLSKEKIAFATIGLIAQQAGTNSNDIGLFTLKSNSNTDTLIITHVGYHPLKIALNDIKSKSKFYLNRKQVLLNDIIVKKYIHNIEANAFKHCSNNYYTSSGHYTQIAQLYNSPTENCMLAGVKICKEPNQSIFRLRIYNIDSVNGKPGEDLCDSVIEIKSHKKNVFIKLEKYKILIPNKEFFIAIEWIYIPFNENTEKKSHSLYQRYNPAISYIEGSTSVAGKISIWHMQYGGNWVYFDKLLHDSRLLISAVIKY